MSLPPAVARWGAPPAASALADWDWPRQSGRAESLTVLDAHAAHVLEKGPAEFRHDWQTRQLRLLLAFVMERSRIWRDAWPTDALQAHASDLTPLPIVDRATLRARIEATGALPLPPWHGRLGAGSTSGSTGQPMRFHVSELGLRIATSLYWADHARHGRDLLRPWASVGGHVPAHPGRSHGLTAPRPWLGERQGLARNHAGAPLAATAAWIAEHRPAYLFTNPTLLSGLLDVWESDASAPTGLEQVATFGATVEPALRERARRLLGASLRDRYSCEEVGPIALQCPHDETRYHVCAANALVEVVDDHGQPCAPGEFGRVLVTGLHRWASPIVRYDIGDVAALHPRCSCGADVAALSHLLGRKRGLIRTPSGEGRFLRITATDWLDIAPVREFRIVQEQLDALRVELVTAQALTPAQREAIETMLRERVDPDLRYELIEREAIDWPPGAKRQDVVSLLD